MNRFYTWLILSRAPRWLRQWAWRRIDAKNVAAGRLAFLGTVEDGGRRYDDRTVLSAIAHKDTAP